MEKILLENQKTISDIAEYSALHQAFDFFNNVLFENKLPMVFLTYNWSKKCNGYFYSSGFKARGEEHHSINEISLNPHQFVEKTDQKILSTLVHEMAHHWQDVFGNPPSGNYHNKEWANKMEEIGLMPSNTGREGGKKTGRNMTHYVIDDGAFACECAALIKNGFSFIAEGVPMMSRSRQPTTKKQKYTCPCGQKVWGKPSMKMLCQECRGDFVEAA